MDRLSLDHGHRERENKENVGPSRDGEPEVGTSEPSLVWVCVCTGEERMDGGPRPEEVSSDRMMRRANEGATLTLGVFDNHLFACHDDLDSIRW